MKINEIAIKENLLTKGPQFVGKALPRIERLPGETMKDAISRAKSELGGVKSADNLVSPAELSALRRDPTPPSSGPAVWRNPSTGEVSNVPPPGGGRIPPRPTGPGVTIDQLRTPTNGPAAMNLDSAKRAAQASAAKKAPAPKSAETTADDLSKEIKPGADAASGRREPSIDTPSDDLAKQIKPGADAPKTTGGQQSSGGKRDPSMDQPPPAGSSSGPGIHPDWSKPPSAAAPPVININTGKESGFPWKTTAAAAAFLGPTAYNQFSPPTAPKFPYTPLSLTGDALVSAGKNFMANQNIPGIDSVTPNNGQPVAPPTQTQVDKAIKSDPANQSVTRDIERWNRDHPDNQIKESYTNELNRLVYLSRL